MPFHQHMLHAHPANAAAPALTIVAGAELLADGGLRFHYTLRGDLASVRLPAAGPVQRQDGLWQHTCCEAFVAAPEMPAYREFNFSPAGAWAAYAFADYRKAETPPEGLTPRIACRRNGDRLSLVAEVERQWLPPAQTLQIGLTVVIEALDGQRSYWALCHPCPQPDFHHRDGFTYRLSRPS